MTQDQAKVWAAYLEQGRPTHLRNAAIETYRKLLFHIANKLHGERPRADYDDILHGVGMGMIRAVEQWNPDHPSGTSFETYAFVICRNRVRDAIRDSWWKSRRQWSLEVAGQRLPAMFAFSDLERARRGDWRSDVTPDEDLRRHETEHRAFAEVDAADSVAFALRSVGGKGKRVIRLQDFEGRGQPEIGRAMGICSSRVCQIRREALDEMRRALTSQRGFTARAAA